MIETVSVHEVASSKQYSGKPLLIAGAGPGWNLFDWNELDGLSIDIFALNHTITELWTRPYVWWVSNDHDRTFQSKHVSKVVPWRIEKYKPWRTITQKKFLPGKLGDSCWIDHKGKEQQPMEWRLPLPDGSLVAHYVAGEYMKSWEGWVHNGESVLELALEVATLWGFSPIVLVGCDMTMLASGEYYAQVFRYKDTPAQVKRGKLNKSRASVCKNRSRWPTDIYLVSELWDDPPFLQQSAQNAMRILPEAGAWNRG